MNGLVEFYRATHTAAGARKIRRAMRPLGFDAKIIATGTWVDRDGELVLLRRARVAALGRSGEWITATFDGEAQPVKPADPATAGDQPATLWLGAVESWPTGTMPEIERGDAP